MVVCGSKFKTSKEFTSKKVTANQLRADFVREMRTLSKLRHPCITTIMGGIITSGCSPMIMLEYMDLGSLYSVLHNECIVLEGDQVFEILADVVSGCNHLHAHKPPLVHGDLKSLNVLVDSKWRAKISDFGFATASGKGHGGTLYWMAPEVLSGGANTTMSDVYAFGFIVYEAFSRKDPFDGEDDVEKVVEAVVSKNKRPPVPAECPPDIAQLMTECWEQTPTQRPTFNELQRRMANIESGVCRVHVAKAQGRSLEDAVNVLDDVFPPHVAEALRQGKKIEAEHYDCVTIFFSDIVGFTNISSTLLPEEVCDMLDRLYHKLDMLADKHELFKVETIGDAYMAVTNLIKQQSDHAARIARFAQEAIEAANSTMIKESDPSMGCINIRVGFHSGPVVANVVGSKNPRYCLFGDTVNTSSRMESNSEKNRIHMSHESAKLVRAQDPSIELEARVPIEIKGKGKMQTYFVANSLASRSQIPWVAGTKVADSTSMELSQTDAKTTEELPLVVLEQASALSDQDSEVVSEGQRREGHNGGDVVSISDNDARSISAADISAEILLIDPQQQTPFSGSPHVSVEIV
eukprot:m.132642 g.132642  ORF g.132642 m.132642 type:complete len:578 (+) comp13940_c0_seq1:2404-4137(+)